MPLHGWKTTPASHGGSPLLTCVRSMGMFYEIIHEIALKGMFLHSTQILRSVS